MLGLVWFVCLSFCVYLFAHSLGGLSARLLAWVLLFTMPVRPSVCLSVCSVVCLRVSCIFCLFGLVWYGLLFVVLVMAWFGLISSGEFAGLFGLACIHGLQLGVCISALRLYLGPSLPRYRSLGVYVCLLVCRFVCLPLLFV